MGLKIGLGGRGNLIDKTYLQVVLHRCEDTPRYSEGRVNRGRRKINVVLTVMLIGREVCGCGGEKLPNVYKHRQRDGGETECADRQKNSRNEATPQQLESGKLN